MNKTYIICLSCGNVQLRTDIEKIIGDKYIFLDKKMICPKCNDKTKVIATKNIAKLKTELVKDESRFSKKLLNLMRG